MGKAKRIKAERNTPVNDMGFPINLSTSEEETSSTSSLRRSR
jgi:hypothetical protein